MDYNIYGQFCLDYKHILIDEIALEGLDGIDIDLLWRRVEKRMSSPLTDKMKKRYWDFITSTPSVSFYELPQSVPYLEIKDRFKVIDEDSGHLTDPDDYLDGPYEYKPVENEFGSCANYHNRKSLDNILSLSYEEVLKVYNQRLVIVASKEERWNALAPHIAPSVIANLTPVDYCILELIGRSRENGQMTIGKTNLLKIVKDSKMLFYHRKFLKNLNLIRITHLPQKMGDRGVKSLLLRLRRFHKSVTMSLPKRGPIYDLVELLKVQPNHSESLENVFQKGILAQYRHKKFQKSYNVFDFSEKQEEIVNKRKKKLAVKRRYISISNKSDSSSGTEDDSNEPVLKCQYKVGISLLRQAYLKLYESGLRGLTQVELAQLLGTEFYTTRSICKMLKSKGLLKEVYEDKGRQRTARLIVTETTANTINVSYEEEWRKFLNYQNLIKLGHNLQVKQEAMNVDNPTTTTDLQRKSKTLAHDVDWNDVVTEIKEVEALHGYDPENFSLLSSKKNLTLRQLKYANGIINVLEDTLATAGYQVLNTLVCTATGEPQMDTRALKYFIQKLLNDGLVKVFKLKWPNEYKYTNYICSTQVTSDHPILKQKYFEILEKLHVAKQTTITKTLSKGKGNRSLSRFAIPRYSKVRKFHEFIFKLAYSNDIPDSTLPEGFCYLAKIIPEMTLEFAIGNVNLLGQINLSNSQVNEHLNMKIKDLPVEISQEVIYASTFRNTLRENLRVLAFFGLIQVVNQPLALNFEGIMFYVNRHAKIVNTSGEWPRQNVDIKELESDFYFGNIDDLVDFWNTVVHISSNTCISLGKRKTSRIKPQVRTMNEVQDCDNGERLGDGNGPCGFDSSFYLDIPRLWRPTMPTGLKKKIPIIKPVQIPKLKRIRKKKTCQGTKSKKILNSEKFRERQQELNEFKIPMSRGKRHCNLKTETWSKLDDLIIVLCKVAHALMGPVSQSGSFRLRNMVAKEILSMTDPKKTSTVCHLRAVVLDSDEHWSYEKQRLLNEIRKNPTLCKKYEGMLKKIRIRYLTNITKYMNEARLPMMELVWMLLQLTKSESYNSWTPCVATNYENFYQKFSICEIPDNKPHKLYHVPNATDYETTLKESIILIVAMSHNKEVPVNMAKKIYAIFKEYPEIMLRQAIEELRKCQAICAREKICNNKVYRMNLQDLVESSYKLSAGYYRKWICKFNADFLNYVADSFDLELPVDDIVGGSGVNCFCCELHAEGLVELATSNPPTLVGGSDSFIQEENHNVFDIESKYKLKSGTILVRSKSNVNKFSFENSKLDDHFTEISRNALVTYSKKNSIVEQDEIVRFLKDKQEKGSTFSELLEYTKCDTDTLIKKLLDLESKKFIKRVGHYDNRIVHIEYAKSWAMTLEGKTFLLAPWITIYGTLRKDIFFKWTNVVMSKIFEHPGCSITHLSESCELISAKCIQDICIFLMQCECITMQVIKSRKVDLFSDDDSYEEPTSYNPYECPSNIFVLPTKTVLVKYAAIRRQLNNSERET